MESAIRAIYTCWNAADKDGMMAAFATLGPNGCTIENVGSAPVDGKTALDEMWINFIGSCTTDLVEVIVNGTEAAAFVHNNFKKDHGVVMVPSIETYKVEDGALTVRYYHRHA